MRAVDENGNLKELPPGFHGETHTVYYVGPKGPSGKIQVRFFYWAKDGAIAVWNQKAKRAGDDFYFLTR